MTSCPTTWRSYRDHRLLWRHFTLCVVQRYSNPHCSRFFYQDYQWVLFRWPISLCWGLKFRRSESRVHWTAAAVISSSCTAMNFAHSVSVRHRHRDLSPLDSPSRRLKYHFFAVNYNVLRRNMWFIVQSSSCSSDFNWHKASRWSLGDTWASCPECGRFAPSLGVCEIKSCQLQGVRPP